MAETWPGGYVPESMEERLFLAKYDPSKFPITVVTVDIAVIAPESVLLIKRGNYPYRGYWALPGGFMDPQETSLAAAMRELWEEAGVKADSIQFVGVADDPERDPRGRAVSILYAGLVAEEVEAYAGDDAIDARWVPFQEAYDMRLAFDHSAILRRVGEAVGF